MGKLDSVRILYLVSSWPSARSHGGRQRAFHVGRALADVGKVTVLPVTAESEIATDDSPQFASEVLPPAIVRVSPGRSLLEKVQWAVDPTYLNLHGVGTTTADRERILGLAKSHDVVWVLNARTPNVLRQRHWSHSHLDLDDLPSTYLESAARHAGGITNVRLRYMRRMSRRRERLFSKRFTTLSVCSEEDRQHLGNGDHIHVIPNGFERPTKEPLRTLDCDSPRLGFIGLYRHEPNRDGVEWFLRECWPSLRAQVPQLRCRLVGQGTEVVSQLKVPGVDGLGWLDDAASEIATWSGMLIPLRLGAGTRIKLPEALSRKCPVVSTTTGAYGYNLVSPTHLRIADTPEDFSSACLDIVRNPRNAALMAERGWIEFLRHWTWDSIAPRVRAAAEDCLRRSRNGQLLSQVSP
jgi:glycosyltransferase involved in cell wall biosynthesis